MATGLESIHMLKCKKEVLKVLTFIRLKNFKETLHWFYIKNQIGESPKVCNFREFLIYHHWWWNAAGYISWLTIITVTWAVFIPTLFLFIWLILNCHFSKLTLKEYALLLNDKKQTSKQKTSQTSTLLILSECKIPYFKIGISSFPGCFRNLGLSMCCDIWCIFCPILYTSPLRRESEVSDLKITLLLA